MESGIANILKIKRMKDIDMLKQDEIQSRIFTFNGIQVMIDRDLAEMYQVPVKRLNEQDKRNIERFPESFRFQLNEYEKIRNTRTINVYAFVSIELLILHRACLPAKAGLQPGDNIEWCRHRLQPLIRVNNTSLKIKR